MAGVGEIRYRHRVYRKNLYDVYLEAMRASYSRGDRRDAKEERFREKLLREYQGAARKDRALEAAEVADLKQRRKQAAQERRRERDRQRYRERVAAAG